MPLPHVELVGVDPYRVVHDAVEDGVGDGVAETAVPFLVPTPTSHTNACCANTGHERQSTNTAASSLSSRMNLRTHERYQAKSFHLIGMRHSTVRLEQRLSLRENRGCAFADDCIHHCTAYLLIVEVELSQRVGV